MKSLSTQRKCSTKSATVFSLGPNIKLFASMTQILARKPDFSSSMISVKLKTRGESKIMHIFYADLYSAGSLFTLKIREKKR